MEQQSREGLGTLRPALQPAVRHSQPAKVSTTPSTARAPEQKQWVKSGRTSAPCEEPKTELAAEDQNCSRLFPLPGRIYFMGFPVKSFCPSTALARVISAFKAFFFFFFPHRNIAFSYLFPLNLSASQTLGLTSLLSLVPFEHQCVMTWISWGLTRCFHPGVVQPASLIRQRLFGFNMCSFLFLQGCMISTLSLHPPASLSLLLFAVPFIFFFSWVSLPQSIAQSDTFGCTVERTQDINPCFRDPLRKKTQNIL